MALQGLNSNVRIFDNGDKSSYSPDRQDQQAKHEISMSNQPPLRDRHNIQDSLDYLQDQDVQRHGAENLIDYQSQNQSGMRISTIDEDGPNSRRAMMKLMNNADQHVHEYLR